MKKKAKHPLAIAEDVFTGLCTSLPTVASPVLVPLPFNTEKKKASYYWRKKLSLCGLAFRLSSEKSVLIKLLSEQMAFDWVGEWIAHVPQASAASYLFITGTRLGLTSVLFPPVSFGTRRMS